MFADADDNPWVQDAAEAAPELWQRAHRILTQNRYCTLATCSRAGLPWATPLLFVADRRWHLFWSSAIAAHHSQNLYQHPPCAITIYGAAVEDYPAYGLYLAGTARELAPANVDAVLALLYSRTEGRSQRARSDYLGDSPRRFYHFQPEQVWITGDRRPVGGQLVDTRLALDLAALRRFTDESH
jgi:hypothetical protein